MQLFSYSLFFWIKKQAYSRVTAFVDNILRVLCGGPTLAIPEDVGAGAGDP